MRPANEGAVPRLALAIAIASLAAACSDAETPARPPNVVVVFADDLGYADVGPYGATDVPTPSLDRLAADGVRLTSFYSAPTCTPSRAMLLTGAYAERVSVPFAYFPNAREGLHPDERTIAEVLRDRGYATAAVGKWHLGHRPPFLPTAQGFDEYFGIPYSNDMGRLNPLFIENLYPPLPLLEGETVVEEEPDQSLLTRRYTERAVDFVRRNADRPFFLYLAHSMPHWPIAASPAFAGSSARGLYGDVVAEIDASLGEVLRALEETGVARDTLVLFTSDNGPWLLFGDHAGSAGPLREGKGTTFEGGVRVPAIARWPGRIPSGRTSDEPVGLIDVLPTVARLAGAELAADRPIDGRDAWPVLSGEGDGASPHQALYLYREGELQAVRSGRWKLHVPHAYVTAPVRGTGGLPGVQGAEQIGRALYDLASDPGETIDVSSAHPDVVARLEALLETMRADLGDRLTGRAGAGVRPPGRE